MSIEFIAPFTQNPLTPSYVGLVENEKIDFPLITGAYRFAFRNNYTENIGFQWNRISRTQIDKTANFYPIKGWWTKLQAKYLLCHFTKKMDHKKLDKKIDNNTDRLIKTSNLFSKCKCHQA